MQTDGNLVLYQGSSAKWESDTKGHGSGPYRLVMQNDGNLVIYDGSDKAKWASDTDDQDGNCVYVQGEFSGIVSPVITLKGTDTTYTATVVGNTYYVIVPPGVYTFKINNINLSTITATTSPSTMDFGFLSSTSN
jgi:hypothetical protein